MSDDYYERLGVSKTADQSEIEKAWKEAVKKTHPDQNDDPNAQEEFLKVKEAYNVLSDPTERERYDRLGHGQYVNQRGRSESGTERRRETYTTEGKQTKSQDRDGSGSESRINWEANTRGRAAADYVWQDGAGPTVEEKQSVDAERSLQKKTLGYGIAIIIPAVVSVALFGSWILAIIERWVGDVIDVRVAALVTIGGIAIVWLSIIIAETILETEKTFWGNSRN